MQLACLRADRPSDAVRLLAVSKAFPAPDLAALTRCGQLAFGENYLQEASPKQALLADLRLEWHFIGRLQRNKARQIAAQFQWVQGIDGLDIARRLGGERGGAPLDICLQVNISAEAAKAGAAVDETPALCAGLAQIDGLRLRGLMAVPAAQDDPENTRAPFRQLRRLFDAIRASGTVDAAYFDTLSMGMSADFAIAIEEGATLIRVGSALFGPRPSRP